MKKEITLPVTMTPVGKTVSFRTSVCDTLKAALCHNRLLVGLSRCYSRLLAEHVSPLRTLRLVHAQLAFFALTFPVVFSLPVRLLVLGWFAAALLQCRRAE
ncbi:MAG: hypothetical protein K2N13_03400 [Paraprevotella sp.]|nr:hypothetical protein [Paraprevotella sp.]